MSTTIDSSHGVAPKPKSRRAGLVAVAVAVLLLVGAEGVVRAIEPWLPNPVLWGDLETQLKVAQQDRLSAAGGADVVFLGSSIVNVGIDPELYAQLSPPGTVVYDAALNGTWPRLLELWMKEIVLPKLAPDVAVIGLTSRALNDYGISQQERFERYVGSIGRAFRLGRPSPSQRIDRALSDVSALVRNRAVIRRPFALFNYLRGTPGQNVVLNDLGAQTGLRSMEYHLPEGFLEQTVNKDLVDYQIGGVEIEALARLVDEIRSTGARVLLVDMPVMEADYIPMHPNGQADYDAYQAALQQFALDHDVQLAKPSDQPWPASHFADPLHLNQTGVDRLTTWLGETVNGR